MPEFDAETLAEHAVLFGLVEREQARAAKNDAEDGTADALLRSMLRKGMLTSWQVERLQKGDPNGFFFGGCKVLFHLAEGTFARVYRGERVLGNRPVAIKVLRQRFVSDPDAIVRFRKEAEAGMKLVHPNIVQILDFGEEDKRHYMIMEYVEGSNLRDLLKIRTRIDATQALPMMIGLASGLKYAFEHGVTHRDIKGTNILISNNGTAKLVDFGLATIEGENKKQASLNQRTVDYSALERACVSPKGDPRSDIFFLGCVFYQMLTGQLAMPEVESKDPLAKMLKRSFGAIRPLSEQRHAPPERLTAIVEKMMKMDLKLRHQSMAQVVDELEEYEKELKASAAPRPVAEADVAEEESFLSAFDDDIVGSGGGDRPSEAVAEPEPETDLLEPEAEPDAGFQPEAFEVKAFEQKYVLCVETQSEIQDAFRKSLSKMGYRVILVGDPELAAERYRESPPDAVVFDADGTGQDGIDSFIDMHDKAHEDGHDLAALVLLGPKQRALKDRLPAGDRLIVLVKPIKMKDVQGALQELAPVNR
jgi:serine/threonine protein kinase/ActR/RegA family two-component response regulator